MKQIMQCGHETLIKRTNTKQNYKIKIQCFSSKRLTGRKFYEDDTEKDKERKRDFKKSFRKI